VALIETGSKKSAIIIAYVSIFVNVLSNLILTPYYLKYLGINDYGLYQTIFSVAQYLLILDLGIGTVLTKYITKFRLNNSKKEEENFAFHIAMIVILITIIIVVAGIVIGNNLGSIFNRLSPEELVTGKMLLYWMIFQVAGTFVFQYLNGVMLSYEKYFISKSITLLQLIMKTVFIAFFITLGAGVLGIVYGDVLVLMVCCILLAVFIRRKTQFKIKFHYYDKESMKSSLTLMIALLMQSVVLYLNNTIDKTILGIMISSEAVAVYSIAMNFITMYMAFPTQLGSVYLPQTTKLVESKATKEELTDIVIRPGRWQFILSGGFLCGFLLFGQQFILLWTGTDVIMTWSIALIIMASLLISNIQLNVLNILTAMNRRLFRSVTTLIFAAANVILTIFMVKKYGIIGAPISTAICYIFGYIIILNIYYKKSIGLNIGRMFKEIFSGCALCLITTTLLSMLLLLIPGDGIGVFIIRCIGFCILYFILLWKYGFKDIERNDIISLFKKLNINLGK